MRQRGSGDGGRGKVRCARGLVAACVLGSLLAPSGAVRAQEDRAARAAVLFEQGRQALEKNDFAEAARKLAESQRLDPGVGTALRLGRAYEGLGKTASAWAAYTQARDLAKQAGDTDRRGLAEARMGDIEKRLMRIRLAVTEEAEGLRITRNGEPVGQAEWGEALPFDPDTYVIEAAAPGRKGWSRSVTLDEEGVTVEVVIPALDREEPSEGAAVVVSGPADAGSGGGGDAPPVEESLSHAWRLGAVARLDIDAEGRGAMLSPGVTFGLGDHLEIGGGATIGKYSGFWAGLTGLVLTGAWKPLGYVGLQAPFVEGELVPALHALVGLQWDPIRHLGVLLGAGVMYTPFVPEPVKALEQVYFVPSIGVQGRL